jgi:hypothetical protein
VNNGIREEWCSLQYASIDHAVEMIQFVGVATSQVKVDLKDANRLVPVHPADQFLSWQDCMYVDHSLGLHLAPKIFTAFSDMIAWAVHCDTFFIILMISS